MTTTSHYKQPSIPFIPLFALVYVEKHWQRCKINTRKKGYLKTERERERVCFVMRKKEREYRSSKSKTRRIIHKIHGEIPGIKINTFTHTFKCPGWNIFTIMLERDVCICILYSCLFSTYDWNFKINNPFFAAVSRNYVQNQFASGFFIEFSRKLSRETFSISDNGNEVPFTGLLLSLNLNLSMKRIQYRFIHLKLCGKHYSCIKVS